MNDGDFDKEWFFEPTGFKLDIVDVHPADFQIKTLREMDFATRKMRTQNDRTRYFWFNQQQYPARLEVQNHDYRPSDFGQFIMGMKPGVLMIAHKRLS